MGFDCVRMRWGDDRLMALCSVFCSQWNAHDFVVGISGKGNLAIGYLYFVACVFAIVVKKETPDKVPSTKDESKFNSIRLKDGELSIAESASMS
jgi:hypothetical protein